MLTLSCAKALRAARRLLSAHALAAVAERALLARDWQARAPQLFIVGLPRSGTTLVYQYVVHRLRVAYFTNGVGSFHRAPCLATWWQHRRHGEYRSDFASRYGKVEGPLAPREAGAFWNRFFPVDDRVPPDWLAPPRARLLRNTVACTQRAFGDAPFVNKNVKHLLRLGALARVFPSGHFLVVERDHEDVACSVLRARRELGVDARRWWSVLPRDHAALARLAPEERVAAQVRSLAAELDEELARLPKGRVHRIDYASFCAAPESCIALLRAALGEIADRNPAVESFRCVRHAAEALAP
jgi:hypothetical protein